MQRLHLTSTVLAIVLTIGTAASAQERPAPTRTLPPAATETPPEAQPRFPPPPTRGEDIEEVLRRVSASTGQEFLVDPRVRAYVFGVPDIGTPTYPELLAILRMHGFRGLRGRGAREHHPGRERAVHAGAPAAARRSERCRRRVRDAHTSRSQMPRSSCRSCGR